MKRLKDLDVEEISLVNLGANKKKFLLFKSKEGPIMGKKIKKEFEGKEEEAKKEADNLDPKIEKQELSEGAEAALKAVQRVLLPFKEEITDAHVDQAISEIGIGFPHEEEGVEAPETPAEITSEVPAEKEVGEDGKEKEITKVLSIPQEVKEEHVAEALSKAQDALNEHLEKLGYKKSQDEELLMKSEDDKEIEKSYIFKAHKELVQKAALMESEIKALKEEKAKKEIIQKAKSFDRLGLNEVEVIETLHAAKNIGEKHYETICKHYNALNNQAKTGALFAEIGSNLSNDGLSDAEAKIDAAVSQIVKKSGNVTQAQAYAKFLETDEGKKLYKEMKESRPHGI